MSRIKRLACGIAISAGALGVIGAPVAAAVPAASTPVIGMHYHGKVIPKVIAGAEMVKGGQNVG